ncbi:hypothetical protein Tco_1091002 [Tanacetum coccineum]|uniref:Uncharacterized protein n=1 Tax=Tanacetum coccineum TaxID=301880 RepID=A0ABQ5I5W4_9ASTR
MRFILAPNSAKAFFTARGPIRQGNMKLPGSLSFWGKLLWIIAEHSSLSLTEEDAFLSLSLYERRSFKTLAPFGMWIMDSRNGRLMWICLKIERSRSSSSFFFCFFNLERKGRLDDLEGWSKIDGRGADRGEGLREYVQLRYSFLSVRSSISPIPFVWDFFSSINLGSSSSNLLLIVHLGPSSSFTSAVPHVDVPLNVGIAMPLYRKSTIRDGEQLNDRLIDRLWIYTPEAISVPMMVKPGLIKSFETYPGAFDGFDIPLFESKD